MGIVGLGGLGHVAVKFAKAMGVKVTVISTSTNKKKEALERLGADSFLISRDQAQMQVRVRVRVSLWIPNVGVRELFVSLLSIRISNA